ncbi:S8 family serine peptidase [Phosphitispora fastidiosa]|uniref:S8 family serine peptidase n=1 Tax=Phosphitispora fastidiosa TaxID=2837202 RepID=UPI001E2AB421|nr:S8 family serine peptidase [Phosphitispora fastidiosa]MBU7005975.1 subtilisin family serine protease [Phosphitispora fastidiosa]
MFDKKMIRIFKAATVLILILVVTSTTAIASTPSDITSHWSKDKIQKWLDQGLASGFPDGTFKPDENISRAEFMAFTNNAFGYTEGKEINYRDVPSGIWYENVVARAAAAGYIAGYPDGTMKPEAPITRQEAAAIISRIQELPANPGAVLKFSDGADVSQWAKGAVGAVIEAAYMNGYPDGSFMPGKYVTRAEALAALDNVISNSITGVVYEQAGLYGPADGIETIAKDVIIKADGITLQNIKVNGDLIIAEEVGEGTVTLNNVTVVGTARVRGGGPDSIVINGGMYNSIVIEKVNNKVRIVAKGVKGPEGKLVGVILTDGVTDKEVIFEGDFSEITVEKNLTGVNLIFNAGTNVNNLVLNSPIDVSGPGNIENTVNDFEVETPGSSSGGSGGSSNRPPGSASSPAPAAGAENVDFLSPVLGWTCSDPDGHALTYDIYFGTDQNLVAEMDQAVKAVTGHQAATYTAGLLEGSTKYYWKVMANDGRGGETAGPLWEFTTKAPEVITNGLGYFKIENNDSTKFIEGFVTHNRGGATVPGAKLTYPVDIFEQPGDIIVTKAAYAATRIQNVYWKNITGYVYGEDSVHDAVYSWDELNYVFEVPVRDTFNPGWTDTPPELLIEGINPGDEVSGTISFDVSLKSGNEFFAGYVYLGGEQRYPNDGFAVETAQIPVTIDTTRYPNGNTYIRILVYDENDNAVLSVIPVVVENTAGSTELPGAITSLNLSSETKNINFGYYSLPVDGVEGANIKQSGLDPVDVSISNRLTWGLAMGASGYKVYRSFDGVDYTLIGTVKLGRFDDYSHLLEIGKKTYYKVVPFNSFGDNEGGALTRFVIPLPALYVYLDSPQNGLKDAGLAPIFSWHVSTGGGDFDESLYGPVTQEFQFSLYDATDYRIDSQYFTDRFDYVVPFELNPGGIYSWDISSAEAFAMFESDSTGFSYAVSTAGNGSANGENIFTTTVNDIQSPGNISVDYLNYQDNNYDSGQVLVKTANLAALEKSLKHYGSESLKVWENIGWSLVKTPEGDTVESFIHKLLRDSDVIMAQPDFMMEAPEPQVADEQQQLMSLAAAEAPAIDVGPEAALDKSWGLQNINAQGAWQQTTGDSNVILAVIDTGVDTTHPEFADKTFIGPYDATGEGNPNVDFSGHGTHVAGIAGDNGRNGKLAGIAWDSPIMPVRVEDSSGRILTSYLIEGTEAVADYVYNNPDYRAVINMSVGGRRDYNFAFKDAIDYALDNGVVFVTSAGDGSKRIPSYPASYNGVIAVAASTPYNTEADSSNTGPWISVAAPGEKIYSTYSYESYQFLDGTTAASPYVAGAAALLLSKYPDLTPIEVKNQLEQTAQGNDFNEELGYGVIDLNAMLGAIEPMRYGSLTVSTNIKDTASVSGIGHGVISVFDINENLVAYGLTGENGGHVFHSMPSGDYQVVLSYYDHYKEEYSYQIQNVSIQPSESVEITVNFSIPQFVIKTSVYLENIQNTEGQHEIPITVVQEGIYEFTTSYYMEDCDTVLYIYDTNGTEIAYNDDYSDGYYSSIMLSLSPGDYTVRIEEYGGDVLNCALEILVLDVIY